MRRNLPWVRLGLQVTILDHVFLLHITKFHGWDVLFRRQEINYSLLGTESPIKARF